MSNTVKEKGRDSKAEGPDWLHLLVCEEDEMDIMEIKEYTEHSAYDFFYKRKKRHMDNRKEKYGRLSRQAKKESREEYNRVFRNRYTYKINERGDKRNVKNSRYVIKYCSRSKYKTFLKKYSNRQVRRCHSISGKGNTYRRIYDYWWNLD